MYTHKNARLTVARRLELVLEVLERDLTLCAAAAAHNVSVPTAHKWIDRDLAEGASGLADRSSRPKRSPRSLVAVEDDDAVVDRSGRGQAEPGVVQEMVAAGDDLALIELR